MIVVMDSTVNEV